MKKKSESHETLSLVFKRDGVPPRMIVDNSKEQSLGEFRQKCCEVDCHLVNTEPYSPWQQAAEGCIKQLKKIILPQAHLFWCPQVNLGSLYRTDGFDLLSHRPHIL